MSGNTVERDDLAFVHNPYLKRDSIKLLEEAGVLSATGTTVTALDDEAFHEVGHLSFFSFFYEEKEEKSRRWTYLVLDEEHIASIWIDETKLMAPVTSSRVRPNPLTDKSHAYGHCNVCPAKNFLGYNLGQSGLGDTLGQTEDIETPDTLPYSTYTEEEAGNCLDCQDMMAEWFVKTVREDTNSLWGMGGTGLLHRISIEPEEYNILDLIVGREPIIEVEEPDEELDTTEVKQLNEIGDVEQGPEYFFNILLGIYFTQKFSFDDFHVNCKMEEPIKSSFEYDIFLIDYDSQKMVVAETTAESRLDGSRLRNKQNAALQLEALKSRYDDLDILYLYTTTADYEDLHTDSATKAVQDNWPPIRTISFPDEDVERDVIDPVNAVGCPPNEFAEHIRLLYDHLLSEMETQISDFIN